MFVVPKRIFRDTKTQLFKPHKTRTNSFPNKDRVYRLKYIRRLQNPEKLQYKPLAKRFCAGHINYCGQ